MHKRKHRHKSRWMLTYASAFLFLCAVGFVGFGSLWLTFSPSVVSPPSGPIPSPSPEPDKPKVAVFCLEPVILSTASDSDYRYPLFLTVSVEFHDDVEVGGVEVSSQNDGWRPVFTEPAVSPTSWSQRIYLMYERPGSNTLAKISLRYRAKAESSWRTVEWSNVDLAPSCCWRQTRVIETGLREP